MDAGLRGNDWYCEGENGSPRTHRGAGAAAAEGPFSKNRGEDITNLRNQFVTISQ
jgi:hypothetical protein